MQRHTLRLENPGSMEVFHANPDATGDVAVLNREPSGLLIELALHPKSPGLSRELDALM